jgi:iron complex transport system ATP-binding protein
MLSLDLAEGELVALVGPNGSGKTSLLHALAGIGRPSGTVEIAGTEASRLPPPQRSRLLSYLPATRDLHWPLAARDAVALSGAGDEEIARAMAALELEPFARRRMDRLSTGERSRVLLARALAPSPRLLLLDEPTANLDPLWQLRLGDLLTAEIRGTSRAALVAMHDLDAAAAFADRLIVMHEGRIAAMGDPALVVDGPAIPDVFGIERAEGRWRPVRPWAGPRSSP